MKKYVKPELFYEHFELSQHIAACDFDIYNSTLSSPETCKFIGSEGTEWAGQVIFVNKNDVCGKDGLSYGFDEYCYYTGTNGMNTFNS